ncbi:MAG: tRNA pseudouridine(38-40) synthase TruA [Bacteroidaceae bacterium]|nr:tRNA pseudouridine(38-40) synthase TruA [Bacteroidaceae bacterium]
MRYFITLAYDGTAYHGWQVQPNGISVQERLEGALSTLLRQPVQVVGAGRTDAGVHARCMVAHFDWPSTSAPCPGEEASPLGKEENGMFSNLTYKLNKLLPRDITIYNIVRVREDAHARFSAVSRTYHYYVHLRKDPFLRQYSWQLYGSLDFARMNEAAAVLCEYDDFTSFSKVNTDVKTNLCHITEARWEMLDDENRWRFTITANRFLRNMVRAIVGTLVEVGRGRLSVDDFRRVIERRDRCSAGESVPAHGLFLVNVEYDEGICG